MIALATVRDVLGHVLLAATLAVLLLLVVSPLEAAALVALGFYAFEAERLFCELRACGCGQFEALGLALILDRVALVIVRTILAAVAAWASVSAVDWALNLPLHFL